ncbi:MAG: hypothetical protein KDA81_19615 [Planctomycetaceae bacterium]|nr:hypothetical protein [Planctomycetaceae bacterium]
MKHSLCRTASVMVLVIVQLMIVPATQLLHVGCEHSRAVEPPTADSVYQTVETVWNWCWPSRCCDHCAERSDTKDGQTTPPQSERPAQPPHDENTCPVCLVAFAARLTTTAPLAVSASERIAELVVVNVNVVKPTPRYSVLSRGPPPACS